MEIMSDVMARLNVRYLFHENDMCQLIFSCCGMYIPLKLEL